MPRTALVKTVASGPYPTAGNNLTLAAADVANGNYFVSTGKELLVAENTDVSPHTVTVGSVADEHGRTGDITAESIAAGALHIFGPLAKTGWATPAGNINVNASDTTVKLAVVTLP